MHYWQYKQSKQWSGGKCWPTRQPVLNAISEEEKQPATFIIMMVMTMMTMMMMTMMVTNIFMTIIKMMNKMMSMMMDMFDDHSWPAGEENIPWIQTLARTFFVHSLSLASIGFKSYQLCWFEKWFRNVKARVFCQWIRINIFTAREPVKFYLETKAVKLVKVLNSGLVSHWWQSKRNWAARDSIWGWADLRDLELFFQGHNPSLCAPLENSQRKHDLWASCKASTSDFYLDFHRLDNVWMTWAHLRHI